MLSRHRGIGQLTQHVAASSRRVQRVHEQLLSIKGAHRRLPNQRNASRVASTTAEQHDAVADSSLGVSTTGEQVFTVTNLTHYLSPPQSPSADQLSYPPKLPSLSTLLPPNPQHTSLASYLAHARRLGLSNKSTTYNGTVYEYIVLSTLRRIGIELIRVGQTGDLGVDLVGYWHLPERTRRNEGPLRVVVQCKRLSKKVGPSVVRELEGAFRGAPSGWRGEDGGVPTVGLVVGMMPATKGVVGGLKRSRRATGWVCVEEVDVEGGEKERDDVYRVKGGKILQVLWNQKAREVGLEGVDVVKRFDEEGKGDEVVLMWRGEQIEEIKETEQEYK